MSMTVRVCQDLQGLRAVQSQEEALMKRVESREILYFSMNHSLGSLMYIFNEPRLLSQNSEFATVDLEISFYPRFLNPI